MCRERCFEDVHQRIQASAPDPRLVVQATQELDRAIREPAAVFCAVCREPLPPRAGIISPVVLRLVFPTGNVDIPAGTSVMLGRDPAESLVAAAFARFDNVSRRHATVQVDDAGHATIRDEGSTNGTYVNGVRIDRPRKLARGDVVRVGETELRYDG